MSELSKIQIRALVLQEVLMFKGLTFPSEPDINNCIENLKVVSDKELLASLLLKEISSQGNVIDCALILVLFNLCDEKVIVTQILKLLNEKNVNDTKKLFLINILREQGKNIDYDFICSHVSNPDEVIDSETKKFLIEAKMCPEVQIDFFDFYFAVCKQDQENLLDSIISDYSGDELANILEPFVYFYPENHLNEKILYALADTKSPLALPPLNWCSTNYPDENLASLSAKLLNKLNLSGLVKNINFDELYLKFLDNSSPLAFWYSIADGNSNVSCVFARTKKNGFVQTFFVVFNLVYGPISCFGFDEITTNDFDSILLRFFKSSLHAKLPLQEGKLLFDFLSSLGWHNCVSIPYEFICWRKLTYDIVPSELSVCDLLCSKCSKTNVNIGMIYKIFSSDLFSNWFFDCSKNNDLKSVVNEIENNKLLDLDSIEVMLENVVSVLLNNSVFKENLVRKIHFQCYILSNSNMQNTANILYSITLSTEYLREFILVLIKKSVYNYFVNRKFVCDVSSDNVFLKKNADNIDQDFLNLLVNRIEDRWTIKEE